MLGHKKNSITFKNRHIMKLPHAALVKMKIDDRISNRFMIDKISIFNADISISLTPTNHLI